MNPASSIRWISSSIFSRYVMGPLDMTSSFMQWKCGVNRYTSNSVSSELYNVFLNLYDKLKLMHFNFSPHGGNRPLAFFLFFYHRENFLLRWFTQKRNLKINFNLLYRNIWSRSFRYTRSLYTSVTTPTWYVIGRRIFSSFGCDCELWKRVSVKESPTPCTHANFSAPSHSGVTIKPFF